MAQVLGHHLETLWSMLPNAHADEAPAITDGLLDLLAAGLRHGGPQDEQSQAAVAHATRQAVCDQIEALLDWPALSTEALCRHFGCSRAYLYRVMQPLGGVHHYIRERRLHRCYRELTNPLVRANRIIDVAFRYGFSNQSHFSRLFKQRFGMTPRDARDLAEMGPAAGSAASPEGPVIEKPPFVDWLNQL